jgi:hypothetical protein
MNQTVFGLLLLLFEPFRLCLVDLFYSRVPETNAQISASFFINSCVSDSFFLLSKRAPSPGNGSQHTTRSASRRIATNAQTSQAPSNPLDSQKQHTSTTTPQVLLPSTSPQDSGPGRGSLFLADIVNVFVSDGQMFEHMQEPTPAMLEEWNEMTLEQKERIYNFMIERWGAVHGQEVVCEAR